MNNWKPEEYLLFEGVTGSQLYGTSRPDSDTDYRGVCMPPLEVLMNPFQGFEQKDSGFEEADRVIYDLGKFMKLAKDANPNVIELLFVPSGMSRVWTPAWDLLQGYRGLFVSKKVRFRFSGYAIAQLKSIQTHRKWFINPPKEEPTRQLFGLTSAPTISKAWQDAIKPTLNLELLDPKYHDEVHAEIEYAKAREAWTNYQAWKKNRNPARQALEEKYGYDVKHAMHLFRLMWEARELLLTGNLTFPRPEAEDLRAILYGKYTYEEVVELASSMDSAMQMWYDESPLQHSPDDEGLASLYVHLVTHRNGGRPSL